jgi:hypothetical protein
MTVWVMILFLAHKPVPTLAFASQGECVAAVEILSSRDMLGVPKEDVSCAPFSGDVIK